jgi:hypothetical protein
MKPQRINDVHIAMNFSHVSFLSMGSAAVNPANVCAMPNGAGIIQTKRMLFAKEDWQNGVRSRQPNALQKPKRLKPIANVASVKQYFLLNSFVLSTKRPLL